MRIDTGPRHKNSGNQHEGKRVPEFLQWLRGRQCLVGGSCAGKIEAAHVDYAGGKGMGMKVPDMFSVPLCGAHHAEQHNAGVKTFEARHSINMLAASKEYWRRWPARLKWELKESLK